MEQAIFNLPRRGDSARAWEICSLLSLLLHGLVLGALVFASPANFVKAPETSVSIDLEMLATADPQAAPAQAETAPPPEPKQMAEEKEAAPRKTVEPTPQPVPKKAEAPKPKPAAKKAEARKPEPQKTAPPNSRPGERLVASNVSPAAKAPVKPASAPPTPPAPVGGASSPRPAYPDLARKRGQEGTVNVRCQVDASGKVTSVSIAKSSGFKLLDDAALKAVGKWKFRAASKDGSSIAGTVVVPVQFRLQ